MKSQLQPTSQPQPAPPIIAQAWALTQLAALALHSAILGLTLSQLISWLETHFDRVGEHSRRTRKP
jgi:hypothetical protein